MAAGLQIWEWSRLVPEWTTGRKVKGTETCGHTVMEPGTSLMTGSTLSHRRDNSTDTHTLLDIQTGSAAIHMLIDESVPVKRGLLSQALQTRGGDLEARLTKALPNSALSLSIYISVFFLSLPHNKHTHTHTANSLSLLHSTASRKGSPSKELYPGTYMYMYTHIID